MKMPGKSRTENLFKKLGKWRRRHLVEHDLVRILDRQEDVLIWCRKCSGYARQRMGPKLMKCCKLEPMGTQSRAWQNVEEHPISTRL